MYLIPLFSNERYLMEIKLPRKSSVVKVDSVTGAKVIGKGICKGIRYIKYKFDNGEIIKANVKYDTDIIYTDSKIPSNIVNSLPNGSFIDPNTDVEYARFHFAIPLILNKSFILSAAKDISAELEQLIYPADTRITGLYMKNPCYDFMLIVKTPNIWCNPIPKLRNSNRVIPHSLLSRKHYIPPYYHDNPYC